MPPGLGRKHAELLHSAHGGVARTRRSLAVPCRSGGGRPSPPGRNTMARVEVDSVEGFRTGPRPPGILQFTGNAIARAARG